MPHSVCIPLRVSHSACIPLRVYSTLCISHSVLIPFRVYQTTFVSNSVCVPSLYLTPCVSHSVSHSMRIPLRVCSTLICYSVCPTPCIPCPNPCITLPVCPTLCVPLLVYPTEVRIVYPAPRKFNPLYVSLCMRPTSCELHFLPMCSTPCVSVYRPTFVMDPPPSEFVYYNFWPCNL